LIGYVGKGPRVCENEKALMAEREPDLTRRRKRMDRMRTMAILWPVMGTRNGLNI
jgi:hypothetical protein